MACTVDDVARFLESFAPTRLAEAWDNVGLLVGDRRADVRRVMTCLTVTPESAAEAIAARAELIVTHHPLPFQPLKQITTDAPTGRLLWDLIGARIAIYSPHTAFDSAERGINRRLAEGLGLQEIAVLVPGASSATTQEGAGRFGVLRPPLTLEQLAERVKQFLGVERVELVGAAAGAIQRVAVACGSAGEFLAPARQAGCDCLVTGETRFHTCLHAAATQMSLILAGHYATERFAVEQLSDLLTAQFAELKVWASREERDPLRAG